MNRTKVILSVVIFLLLLVSTGLVYADSMYTVQYGDTLSAISLRFGVSVQAIANANNIINPNYIYAGQTLIIPDGTDPGSPAQPTPPPADPSPPVSGGTVYVVQLGDTLSRIAIVHGVTTGALVQANNLSNPNLIYAGQTLIIPGVSDPGNPGGPPPTPAPPPPPGPIPPQPGPNILPNPSFESGHYNLNGSPELQIPNSWQMEFDQGIPAPGTGVTLLRPESRVLPRWELPAHEHDLFIWNGDWTIKVFKAHAPVSFRQFTDIHLEPGTYRFVGHYFPDLIVGYDSGGKIWMTQPQAGEVAFIGPGGGGWASVTPGIKNALVHEFTVTTPGTVRLGVAFRTRYAIPNSGFFIDDWSLQRMS
ncbi:MAG: LysM peptidoglycan-binding domain-containing protein [Candidatus Promineifilaceae bacterium]